jgi:hypothetical protein
VEARREAGRRRRAGSLGGDSMLDVLREESVTRLGWNHFTDAQQKRRNDVDTGLSLYRYMDSISRNIYGL